MSRLDKDTVFFIELIVFKLSAIMKVNFIYEKYLSVF
jgi:hypothetical protein